MAECGARYNGSLWKHVCTLARGHRGEHHDNHNGSHWISPPAAISVIDHIEEES